MTYEINKLQYKRGVPPSPNLCDLLPHPRLPAIRVHARPVTYSSKEGGSHSKYEVTTPE